MTHSISANKFMTVTITTTTPLSIQTLEIESERCWSQGAEIWTSGDARMLPRSLSVLPWNPECWTKNLPVILKACFQWTSNLTKVSVGFEYCHYLNNMCNIKLSQKLFLIGPNDKVQNKFPFEKNSFDFPCWPGWFMLVTILVLV